MAQPPPCCTVLETRTQDPGWRGVLEPLGRPRGRSFPDAALSGVAHRDCLTVGHVKWSGVSTCCSTFLGPSGSLRERRQSGRTPCLCPAGWPDPSPNGHLQPHSDPLPPLIPHPCALKPPSSLVCSPLPRCSLPPHTKPTHVLSNTHKYTHPYKDTSYSFPLQGRVRGAAPGISPVSPLPPSALYTSVLLASAARVLWGPAPLCSQGTGFS